MRPRTVPPGIGGERAPPAAGTEPTAQGMKKKTLEMILQKIPPLSDPRPELEQYSTPADVASDVLFEAYSRGDVEGKAVLDLGCGNGILAIGAHLLGARIVAGVEIDPRALHQARSNAEMSGADLELILADVRQFSTKADTVVMNPAFGAQRKGADRPFLDTAMSCADAIYSIHMAATERFLARYVEAAGFRLDLQKRYKFEIPHMFAFHTKTKKGFEVALLCIRKSR